MNHQSEISESRSPNILDGVFSDLEYHSPSISDNYDLEMRVNILIEPTKKDAVIYLGKIPELPNIVYNPRCWVSLYIFKFG